MPKLKASIKSDFKHNCPSPLSFIQISNKRVIIREVDTVFIFLGTKRLDLNENIMPTLSFTKNNIKHWEASANIIPVRFKIFS